jgi:hypothetical protein
MNKYQKWLILSIIFLISALIMPIYVLYNALGNTLQTAVNIIPDYSSSNPATGGMSAFLQAQQAAQVQLVILVVIAEAVLTVCFVATLWYAIKCRDQCRNFPSPTKT